MHARGVAKKLGIRKVICPPGAGVASAIGLLVAPVAADISVSLPMAIDGWDFRAVRQALARLSEQGQEVVVSAGVARQEVSFAYSVDLRHVGQGHAISVKVPGLDLSEEVFKKTLLENFFASYKEVYGRRVEGSEVESLTWRVRAAGRKGDLAAYALPNGNAMRADVAGGSTRPVYFEETSGFVETAVYSHYSLKPGTRIKGPAIIQQRESTTVIGPGDEADIDGHANIVIRLNER